MLYTVHEVADISKVTIKTLHHYHKIGLLLPREVSEAGYRLYGKEELERLQHILFYRELEFPLARIKQLLDRQTDRLSILAQQEELLLQRKRRLEQIMQTLRTSITCMEEGKTMDNKELFKGFGNENEWNEALAEQNVHLQKTYGAEALRVEAAAVPDMNEQAAEAATFMNAMAAALREGIKCDGETVERLLGTHLEFMRGHGHAVSPDGFAAQTRFFLQDDFHLNMLEDQQTGLAYYVCAAAQSFAAKHR
ncbi:MerR family transcriptional regulator [Paenibacillus ginsengarvi]|uniref:MerR family transcriptional regulator n=1 Tax=Paenibacillus ginsengarvi TaxID=400777 RepID=A0A3B0CM37_9BACL|nr:MerR family transcriptional regulator [Paenibacillus ginsengarvi]RKN85437.1 MerR family transcriptional regulator [Paenibacillus ginsengarvi]